uniref:Armadillo repeat-containing domain-containing protein n=1 Tax=Solanum lycopersicum TaxID=4081 RepID=A0A3Q7FZT2_SOLLC
MFTNSQRQEERTGKYGTPRVEYLQQLVTQFQNASSEETKEKIVANLANFAYDPYNFTFLRQVKKLLNECFEYCNHRIFLVSCLNISCDVKQLNVIELFLDCLTEPNEKLVEFGIGGICNACADPANAALVTQNDGIPLIVQCLSSPVRSTVNYALGALYYLCNASNKEKILKPEVIDAIKSYAAASEVSTSFSNLAQAFLDKHVPQAY